MKILTQREKILALLRTAGPAGINSFGVARRIALQLPTRINELKAEGYLITTRTYKNRSKDYILISEPAGTKRPEKTPRKIVDYLYVDGTAIPVYDDEVPSGSTTNRRGDPIQEVLL
jgi:hypothetical protein